jgi:hypothetical protein
MSHGDCLLMTVQQVSWSYNKLWSTGFTGIDQHFEGTCCLLVQVQLGEDAVGIYRQVARKITHSHRSGRDGRTKCRLISVPGSHLC